MEFPVLSSVWLEQTRRLYREAMGDADLLALLAPRGLTQEMLESGMAEIDAVVTASHQREAADGKAQQSTKDRDVAAEALNEWVRKFWKVAEVALADQPQWLEQLGRYVKS